MSVTPCGPDDSELKDHVVLVHGFATTPHDLDGLAESFARSGFSCSQVTLLGHQDNTFEELDELDSETCIATWSQQLCDHLAHVSTASGRILVVGFSVGATIALHVAARCDVRVDGVVGLSTFLQPTYPRTTSLITRLGRRYPPFWKRRLNTTVRSSATGMPEGCSIPNKLVRAMIRQTRALPVAPFRVPTLLLHSSSDPVADYASVATLVRQYDSPYIKLISLHGLKHYAHLDVSADALRDVALSFVDPTHSESLWQPPGEILAEHMQERDQEVRNWANQLWLVFAGGLAAIGVILYETVGYVVDGGPGAPFLLLMYSALISIYLQQYLLYFFYLNRAQAYVRLFVEPLIGPILGFTEYRNGSWISGSESRRITPLVSSGSALIFLLVNVGILFDFMDKYGGELGIGSTRGRVLTAFACLALGWLIAVLLLGRYVQRHYRVHYSLVPPFLPASRAFMDDAERLIASAGPRRLETRWSARSFQ